jgi:hypothetical protein
MQSSMYLVWCWLTFLPNQRNSCLCSLLIVCAIAQEYLGTNVRILKDKEALDLSLDRILNEWIGVVQLAHQREVPSRTHQSTIIWIFTVLSLIIDYWIDNGIYRASIMIIINLVIDKSKLCYKITIKYWQNVLNSQLY